MKTKKSMMLAPVMMLSIALSLLGCSHSGGTTGTNNTNAQANNDKSTVMEMKEFKDIKAKADKGDIEAQCWMAICLRYGLYGCKIDKPQMQELFQKVAKHTNENLAVVHSAKGFVTLWVMA
ncbi:hypothetical protein AGMMS50229_20760 [Campylobacterota bacterium]|nr:hypothetical protein AGMMS50229_20760 [Campylobacterota bacterium]